MTATAAPPPLKIVEGDIASRKKIGRLHSADVYHLMTKGGYNMIVTAGRGKGIPQGGVLGLGPHPGVARFTAQKYFPELQITDLSKSGWDELSRAEMAAMLPEARRVLSQVWAAK